MKIMSASHYYLYPPFLLSVWKKVYLVYPLFTADQANCFIALYLPLLLLVYSGIK